MTNTNETLFNDLFSKIYFVLTNMEDYDLMYLWNGYAQENRMYDDEVFTMEQFDEIYANYDPTEVATRCFYGHDENRDESSFNPNRSFFYLNGYGNPVSLDYIGWNEYSREFGYPSLNYGYDRMIEDIISGDYETDVDEINELLEQEQ